MAYLKEILSGLWSLLLGMGITFRHIFDKPVTILYPKEEIAAENFKGPIAFTEDAEDGSHNCIACNACIKACPSRCMHLEIAKDDAGKRVLSDFKVDHMLCSLCSTCIEVCPTDALTHNRDGYDEVSITRDPLIHDLIQPFRDGGIDVNQPIRTPAQKKAEREKQAAQNNAQPPQEKPEDGGSAT